MALDADDEDADADADEHTATFQTPSPSTSLGHLRFSTLLETVLQDAQTRLVFRAQAVMQTEVLRYAPVADDLDYPDKLRHSKRLSTLFPAKDKGKERAADVDEDVALPVGSALLFELPSAEAQETWYPTLRKTLWVLSKLHTYVKVRPVARVAVSRV
jgi:hypothetical protein